MVGKENDIGLEAQWHLPEDLLSELGITTEQPPRRDKKLAMAWQLRPLELEKEPLVQSPCCKRRGAVCFSQEKLELEGRLVLSDSLVEIRKASGLASYWANRFSTLVERFESLELLVNKQLLQ
jgi:hypothetical protein